MRSLSTARLPALAALLLSAAPAAAQEPPAVDAFAQAMAARQVADFARRQKDVRAMLTAAAMLREIPTQDQPGAEPGGFGAAALFAEARAMAGGDARVRAEVDFAEKAARSRGVVASAFGKGLVRSVRVVDPRGAYRFTVTAAGGTPLRVGAIGDVGTALAMRVQDGAGRTLCLDDNADYAPVCQLTPKTAGQYRIDILNKSGARSRAVILSN
ncbi:hypothetical protein [Sphingomonas corticis]|jgi:hypothetical protein|uniref:Uncharacterized protein n=1 Tax=Sphingomonas corticis TaxID=2722791 RepID=A0ABX1CRD8_9SPHN|nr:hypothetical protein [Sphingomonas corticis]NJR78880.1 hypothetical protein [Sphingomonas corticis]